MKKSTIIKIGKAGIYLSAIVLAITLSVIVTGGADLFMILSAVISFAIGFYLWAGVYGARGEWIADSKMDGDEN